MKGISSPLGNKFIDRGDFSGTDFSESTFTAVASWADLDLSSIIPAGTTAVLITLYIRDSAVNSEFDFRTKGNVNISNKGRLATHFKKFNIINPLILMR